MRGRIVQRGARGTWWYYASLPGRRQYARSLRTTDRRTADLRAAAHEAGVLAGTGLDGSARIREWLSAWIAGLAESGRTPSTRRAYKRMAERYIEPRIGGVRMDALTVEQVERMDADLLRRGGRRKRPLDPVTVRQAHEMLAAALHEAERKGHILRNVAALAHRPRVPHRPVRFLETSEALRLLDAGRAHAWGAFAAVAVLTGLRAGELCGLRWEDVDIAGGSLSVCRQRRYDGPGAGFVDAPPKSAAGSREVALSGEAVAWLSAVRARQEEHSGLAALPPAEHVFAHPGRGATRGRWVPWTPPAAARGVGDLYAAAGIETPKRPIHALRHTFGTLMAEAREDPKVRAALLGHSRVTTTYDYTHRSRATGRRAVGEVGRMLRTPELDSDNGSDKSSANA